MRRAGGYISYWSAYQRELLRDARPLDDVWAGATQAGRHTCMVGEVQHGWEFVRIRCDFPAAKRVWMRLEPGDPRTEQLCRLLGSNGEPGPGEWRHLAADLLGVELEVEVEVGGEVDVLVCPDRTYVVVGAGGGGVRAQCAEWKEVDAWLETTGVTRRRARITRVLGIRANG